MREVTCCICGCVCQTIQGDPPGYYKGQWYCAEHERQVTRERVIPETTTIGRTQIDKGTREVPILTMEQLIAARWW